MLKLYKDFHIFYFQKRILFAEIRNENLAIGLVGQFRVYEFLVLFITILSSI